MEAHLFLTRIYNKSCPIHATEHMCDTNFGCIYVINTLLHVLFCITPCIMPLVPVSALVLRTRADTGTSGHDTGRNTEQDM